MRYYPIMELNIKAAVTKLKKLNMLIKEGELILTHNGLYKCDKNGIFIYKLNGQLEDDVVSNIIINDVVFIKTVDLWERKYEISNIPYSHKKIKYKYFNFSLSPKYEIKFVIEIINDTNNYYFETTINDDGDDNIPFFIKKDICLFLEKLK